MPLVIDEMDAARVGGFEFKQKGLIFTTQATYERCYYVLSDHLGQDESAICTATGVPPLLSVLNTAFCQKVSAKEIARVKHPVYQVPCGLYEVTCNFDSNLDASNSNSDPTAVNPLPVWNGDTVEEPLAFDAITGAAVMTTAGEFRRGPQLHPPRVRVKSIDSQTILTRADIISFD